MPWQTGQPGPKEPRVVPPRESPPLLLLYPHPAPLSSTNSGLPLREGDRRDAAKTSSDKPIVMVCITHLRRQASVTHNDTMFESESKGRHCLEWGGVTAP